MDKIDFNQTANSSNNQAEKPSVHAVDQLADDLVQRFNNKDYHPWYCKIIYTLGPTRVRELIGRVSDASDPAKLFSKLAKEELMQKQAKEKLNG